jgi:hypothetical protein
MPHQILPPILHYYIDNDAVQNRGVVCRRCRTAPSSPHTCYSLFQFTNQLSPSCQIASPIPPLCIDDDAAKNRGVDRRPRCLAPSSPIPTYSPFLFMNQPSPSCQIASPIPPLCIDDDAARNHGVDRRRRHPGPAPSSPHHPLAISPPPVAMPGPGDCPHLCKHPPCRCQTRPISILSPLASIAHPEWTLVRAM